MAPLHTAALHIGCTHHSVAWCKRRLQMIGGGPCAGCKPAQGHLVVLPCRPQTPSLQGRRNAKYTARLRTQTTALPSVPKDADTWSAEGATVPIDDGFISSSGRFFIRQLKVHARRCSHCACLGNPPVHDCAGLCVPAHGRLACQLPLRQCHWHTGLPRCVNKMSLPCAHHEAFLAQQYSKRAT